jgi:hypothetical protein
MFSTVGASRLQIQLATNLTDRMAIIIEDYPQHLQQFVGRHFTIAPMIQYHQRAL